MLDFEPSDTDEDTEKETDDEVEIMFSFRSGLKDLQQDVIDEIEFEMMMMWLLQ